MQIFPAILKYLAIWFIASIPLALIVGKFLKHASEQCLSCGGSRRQVITTEGYAYFECLACKAREAEKTGNPETVYPLNRAWLNGKEWC